MPIWNVPTTAEEPKLTLRRWFVIECTDGHRYVLGWCPERHEGRVSTAIISFDPASMTLRTQSGRLYLLAGEPGFDPDAAYTWGAYARVNELAPRRDATRDYWASWTGKVPIALVVQD
jgi:hypothetical protein